MFSRVSLYAESHARLRKGCSQADDRLFNEVIQENRAPDHQKQKDADLYHRKATAQLNEYQSH